MHANRESRSPSDSFTSQIQIVMPQDTNPSGRLFGGVLVQWIDIVASVVARRHSGFDVATAYIDSVEFNVGASIGATIVMEGFITYVGNTSMEIKVNSFIETYENGKTIKLKMNLAYLVMVALDDNNLPTKVPQLRVTTEEEKEEWRFAEKRVIERKKKRGNNN